MGCCFSTPKNDQYGLKNQHLHLRSHAPKSNATKEVKCRSPPPPPPVVEEEFVNEVLLETPISKPQVPILKPETKTQMAIMQTRKDPIINKAFEEASEEVSLVSETCSVGESFSTITATATATVTETKEDKVTSKRSTEEGTRNRNQTHSDASRKRSYTVERNRNGGTRLIGREEGEKKEKRAGKVTGRRRGRRKEKRESSIDLIPEIIDLVPGIVLGDMEATWMNTWVPHRQ